MCYRWTVAYRYVIMSVLAITFVLLVTWNQEDNIYKDIAVKNISSQTKRMGSPSNVVEGGPEDIEGTEDRGSKSASHNRPHCPKKGVPTQVILLTYGRSGSSLTADILQKHDDVFFHYEPLHNLAKSFTNVQKEYRKRYMEHLYLTAIKDYNKETERVCELLLTCNYTHLPYEAYWNLHLVRSASTKPIRACLKHTEQNQTKVQECLVKNSARCTLKPIQLIKTIRMAAESVGNLMAKMPNLKLIYLMRDPRGSYLSKLKAFPNDFSRNATYEALRICPRLKRDVDATLRMYRAHPNRVHITRYESIAEDPVGISRKLYQFLCLDFSPSIEKYIVNNTMGGTNQTDKNIYAVRRQDSKAASYAWRSKMDIEKAVSFDEHCTDVYEKLGYLPVDDMEHLRDLDTPLKVDMEYLL